ncbi:DinB family protein [Sediminicola luteus]|uniref:DinB-like domain-containing protein n=1 Tax=Sediminicola luteus TaxID=319238 RepID=A0A2A4GEK5_9FLAO|nr:DinB family protein [Sediminicola luteus]PCE66444.1 hypothetical protein B7P33_03880 [Sediminicola luteus]
MTSKDVLATEFQEYYQRYIDLVPNSLDLEMALSVGAEEILAFFKAIPMDTWDYAYAEGKWTVKEVLQHIVDTERVFAYRMFRIGRHDHTPLPGFDQDVFVKPSRANDKSPEDLLKAYLVTRGYTQSILDEFSETDLTFIGTASDGHLSARAAAFIILGHERWHLKILRERYF